MVDKDSPIKRKFAFYLKKRFPNLKDKDLPYILSDIQRFVKVVQKIYTEPQAQVSYKDIVVNGKKVKQRIFTTDLKEVMKVTEKEKQVHPLLTTLSKFTKEVSKNT